MWSCVTSKMHNQGRQGPSGGDGCLRRPPRAQPAPGPSLTRRPAPAPVPTDQQALKESGAAPPGEAWTLQHSRLPRHV